MATQTELSLHSLLPTVSFLQPELITFSNSLIAQSRSKAASLKAEEEVARTYVCCHIACERLGNKLALEIGKPRPPVKPRVYDKLKTYFNAVLKSGGPGTPRSRKVQAGIRGGNEGDAPGSTPVKTSAGRKDATTPSSTSRKRTATGELKAAGTSEVPKSAMTLIRQLCKEYDASNLVPHAFAGVSSALSAREQDETPVTKRRRTTSKAAAENDGQKENIPTLVTAIFAITYQKAYGEELAGDPAMRSELAKKAEKHCRDNAGVSGSDDDIDIATKLPELIETRREEFCSMEWYENIPILGAEDDMDFTGGDGGGTHTPVNRPSKTPLRRKEKHAQRPSDDRDDLGAAGLRPGLGTMFQPAIDWLSDERRDHYVQWKVQILKEVRMLERLQAA